MDPAWPHAPLRSATARRCACGLPRPHGLVVENLALRHQLSTFVHCGRRPRVGVADRVFWVTLRRVWVRWSEVLLFVQPETVVRWHRAGFRKYWTWLSQHHRREGRPSIGEDLRALILRMASENPTWGAPLIHGELRMLGIEVSERTVSRISSAASTGSRRARALDRVPAQSPRRDRGHGFLHGPDRDIPRAVCRVRH